MRSERGLAAVRLALDVDPRDLTPDFLGANHAVTAGARTLRPVERPQQRTDSPAGAVSL
ncbi:hypothetical protein ACFCX0_06370 [Streptomyces sp. NPDC056352]|uniref:hypothetical protein n=1 Tax=Streptomyces sp. NPDC056352 TaxID=3345791 RepID=UPI0035DB4BDC